MARLDVLEDSPTQWTTAKEEGLKAALEDGTTGINTQQIEVGGSTFVASSGAVTLLGSITGGDNSATGMNRLGYSYADGVVSALGNLGATEAIDWATATHFTGTLDSNVTITHSNELTGQKITLFLSYDGSAQRTITWSDVDTWLDNNSGAAPTSPSASGNVLVVTLIYIGTTCYGTATGNYAVYS